MKPAFALILGVLIALPVYAADCHVTQGAVVNASIGIDASVGAQGACLPGDPGQPGNLIGFAFKLVSCQSALVERTRVQFQIADAGDQWHHYLWRDQAGLPNDACGLECAVATNLTISVNGPTLQTFDWPQPCACEVVNGEAFYVGVVYANVTNPADWRIGRNNVPVGPGNGFRNTTGNHGAWVELSTVGFANRFAVEATIGPDCGLIPVEGTSWGAVKNLYQ
jgi:hypothetical protein